MFPTVALARSETYLDIILQYAVPPLQSYGLLVAVAIDTLVCNATFAAVEHCRPHRYSVQQRHDLS